VSITRTLTIAASTVAVGLGALAVAPAATADNNKTVIVNCLGKGVVKPNEIVVSCADGAITVMNIKWSSWKVNRAQGSGTLAWNTCLPTDCASGIEQKYKVAVTLGRVASGPTAPAFTRMTLAFPNLGPAAAETSTYTLDNEWR